MQQIPVYAFTGFLDSGKTKFIQETLEDERFNSGERTLLLVFEAKASGTFTYYVDNWRVGDSIEEIGV